MLQNNNLHLTFDPSEAKVLGVFGELIHVKVSDRILQIPEEEYLKIWKIWIESKRNY
jgi:hypothetical protein